MELVHNKYWISFSYAQLKCGLECVRVSALQQSVGTQCLLLGLEYLWSSLQI